MPTKLCLAASSLALLAGGSAGYAQAQTIAASPSSSTADESDQPNEIVVTGSRIRSRNQTSISPVTSVGSEDFKLQGATKVEDLLNNLPQIFSSQSSNLGLLSTGTATVDLRGLGANRTLVLIDGRRLGPGDPQNVKGYAADINFIPASLIERVEVLTGGASATYGSDALAGVVNFIMKKDLEGVRVNVTGGGRFTDNNTGSVRGPLNASGYPYPSGRKFDAKQIDINVAMGTNTSDGRGNVTAYAGYRRQQAVYQSARDYSACQLGNIATGFSCAGSGTTAPAHIIASNPQTGRVIGPTNGYILGADGNFVPYTTANAFNYGPYNMYQRPDTRYTLGAFGHYEFDPKLDVYTQLMFMQNKTTYDIAPSGIFGQTFGIACNNPLLSAAQSGQLCGQAGLGASDTVDLTILRRNVEGGARITNIEHQSYRILLGAKGDLGGGWRYDSYLLYHRASYDHQLSGEFSLRRTANALDVVAGADGSLQCRTDVANGCVPYTLLSPNGIADGALSYLQASGFQTGFTTEKIASASLSGDLGTYGIKSPWASNGIGIALGVEHRSEKLQLLNDEAYLSGDLAGAQAYTDVNGSMHLNELFGELRIPLVEDMPLIKSLSLEAGYRYSDYSANFSTSTYKFGGEWAPSGDVRLRASFNRAVRAPNILELYTPQVLGTSGSFDPCANDSITGRPSATFEQCARTGVTAAQYGNIAPAAASEYNGILGGNPDLKPETSNTLTFGFVATPLAIPRLVLSADFYDIKIKNVIGKVGADNIMSSCINNGELCSLIQRSTLGSLWIGRSGYTIDTNVNAGLLRSRGIDFNGSYAFDIPGAKDLGSLSLAFQGTYLDSQQYQPIPGGDRYDCVGLYGIKCSTPESRWRHQFRVTFKAAIPLQISAQWRYLSAVKAEGTSSNPALTKTTFAADRRISAYNYFDLTVGYTIADRYELRVGANNLFDKRPPLIGAATGGSDVAYGGNTYPGIYDPLGRYVFASLSAAF